MHLIFLQLHKYFPQILPHLLDTYEINSSEDADPVAVKYEVFKVIVTRSHEVGYLNK